MNRLTGALLAAMLVFCAAGLSAQTVTLTPEQARDKLVAGKIGKAFPLRDMLAGINGRNFDFSHIRRPVFVYIGEQYCIICSFEFPVFLEMCKRFPKIAFVYLTSDDAAVIRRKFGAALALKNLYACSVESHYLWDRDIAKVYPVKYFINAAGIVQDASTGGELKDKDKVRNAWLPVLESLL